MEDSSSWLRNIEARVEDREHGLKAEREALENKFKEQRSKFLEDLRDALQKVMKFRENGNLRQVDEYLERIHNLNERFTKFRYEAEKLNEKEEMLGWEFTEFEDLKEAITKLQPYSTLWNLVFDFNKSHFQWTRGPLFSLHPDQIEEVVNQMAKTVSGLIDVFDKQTAPSPKAAAEHVADQIEKFKGHLALVHAVDLFPLALLSAACLIPRV